MSTTLVYFHETTSNLLDGRFRLPPDVRDRMSESVDQPRPLSVSEALRHVLAGVGVALVLETQPRASYGLLEEMDASTADTSHALSGDWLGRALHTISSPTTREEIPWTIDLDDYPVR